MLFLRPVESGGEDSFSFWSALVGGESARPVRSAIVHDSNQGLFAIREGDWKLTLGQGGGGIGWSVDETDPSAPPGQLYHLGRDLDERENAYNDHPDIVDRLTKLFKQYRARGRSTPVSGID